MFDFSSVQCQDECGVYGHLPYPRLRLLVFGGRVLESCVGV